MPRHQVSRAAIEHLKRFEGLRLTAARLPDGRWTIGHGHTRSAREGARVNAADAEALLIYDLTPVEAAVDELVFAAITQNQFDALVALAFNIGLENFQTSTVLRRVNEGAFLQAACEMELWRAADFEGDPLVVDALVRRRSAEKAMFLTPPGATPASPTPLLTPRLDLDREGLVPRRAPATLEAPATGEARLINRTPRRAPVAPGARPQAPAEDDLTWLRRIAATTTTSAKAAPSLGETDAKSRREQVFTALGFVGVAIFLAALLWSGEGGLSGWRWAFGLTGLALGCVAVFRLFAHNADPQARPEDDR